MLRVDPHAKGRLQEIIASLTERIEDAKTNGRLGEVEGLKTSRTAAVAKLTSLKRAERNTSNLTEPACRAFIATSDRVEAAVILQHCRTSVVYAYG